MTTFNVSLVDAGGNSPVVGDHMTITRTVTGLTTAQVIEKAWFTVKSSVGDADGDAVLQLVITTASTAAGQITDDGTGATEGTIQFTVSGADFDDILARNTYSYDIQVLLDDDTISTLETGTATWKDEVTKATS